MTYKRRQCRLVLSSERAHCRQSATPLISTSLSMLASPGSRRALTVVVMAAEATLASLEARVARLSGDEVKPASTAGDAARALEQNAASLLIMDTDSLGEAWTPLLRDLRASWPDLAIDALASSPTSEFIVDALAAGASDVIDADSPHALTLSLEKAWARQERAPALPPPSVLGDLLIGNSPVMQRVGRTIRQVAPSAATVLIRGESGTGKELVARALHRLSPLSSQAFIKIDCAALPANLLESELFGYEKGAFTGAASRKLGRVELAQGGTLFLDEVGELELTTQAKLLRLLQDREIERLGGTRTLKVEARVIAATHRDLESMVDQRQFREDLFYRLNVVPVWLPPLRARRDDVPELAKTFCQQAAEKNRRRVQLGDAALSELAAYRWPGNVRQLQNFVERLVVLSESAVIEAGVVRDQLEQPLPFSTQEAHPGAEGGGPGASADDHLSAIVRDAEKRALQRALAQCEGKRSDAARVLGLSRSTFYAKLKQHGLA
jgi:two-component system, NtrC family, response regulator AtoC